jgi:hypothetical protein
MMVSNGDFFDCSRVETSVRLSRSTIRVKVLQISLAQLLLVMLLLAICAAIAGELIRRENRTSALQPVRSFDGFVPERIVEEPER